MKSCLLYCLLLSTLWACNRPTPKKPSDIIQIDAITRDSDLLADYPVLHFVRNGISGYEFNDERYIQLLGMPVAGMTIAIDEDKLHLKRVSVALFKNKQDAVNLKEKLTALYGKPGADSTGEFYANEENDLLVWKNQQQLMGLSLPKNINTVTEIAEAPTFRISFIQP
ncbi:hypothetical protein HGH93_13080 [Chitinophaga polysaccharea]|uniref:hypothetical protein n=1 Tax=Chitinophaga TaxID=79328 RepID=UPI0014557E52|nr:MULTISPECIES: hypothetical protein [Chitinophaga]NLR59041.1 hypothetical protein [Chitinophaga polysaccharea]NLU92188.1 hypothetical protein [Chitinophaga sp. Ak27]